MRVPIRRAKPEDACAIGRIATLADLASIDADAPRLREILGQSRPWVAVHRGEIVGFADGFFSRDLADRRRFELDLLAVAPAGQGRGIGASLMAASLAAAIDGGAHSSRALVRCDNSAMQRLCCRQGFSPSLDRYELYIASPQSPAAGSRQHDARLLLVDTLGYAGIWLEGELSQAAIDAAHWLASQSDASLIGAVIPVKALAGSTLLKANSFRIVGQYHWWAINLRSD